ncbi:MAG: hypothetical protein HOP17_03280 [Acidobacteria bacterium]|nr:hypothetical protein [Acidobacteriota bacterium]
MEDQASSSKDDLLRNQLGEMLKNGLKTEWEERAYTSQKVNSTVARLQAVASDDYKSKLVLGGFTLEPYGEDDDISQSCATCMYYLKHRRYCELPELDCPVEPEWSCILWRI